jgi:hypothetical protein
VDVVLLLKHYFDQSSGVVSFRGSTSEKFRMSAGVRQGSILGGILWNIYFDTLLRKLKDTRVGCQLGDSWSGAFAYADDLCLASPTLSGLRQLAHITDTFSKSHQVRFNPSKSKLISVGTPFWCGAQIADQEVLICGSPVASSTQIRYLGFDLRVSSKGNLSIDVQGAIRSLFSSANSIIALPSCSNIPLRTRLIKAIALPCVDYALQLWCFIPAASKQKLHSAVMRVLRRTALLHQRCSSDIACAVAGIVTPSIRAGQLMSLTPIFGNCGRDANNVLELRRYGLSPRTAARTVFLRRISPDHIERARCISGLHCKHDRFAVAMARNISMPSSLVD